MGFLELVKENLERFTCGIVWKGELIAIHFQFLRENVAIGTHDKGKELLCGFTKEADVQEGKWFEVHGLSSFNDLAHKILFAATLSINGNMPILPSNVHSPSGS